MELTPKLFTRVIVKLSPNVLILIAAEALERFTELRVANSVQQRITERVGERYLGQNYGII